MNTILVMRGQGADRASYLASMYNTMHSGIKNISLSADDLEQHEYLHYLYQSLSDKNEKFVSDNSCIDIYPFTINSNGEKAVQFQWIEYSTISFNSNVGLVCDIEQDLSKATCILILINGELFSRADAKSPEEYKRCVSEKLSTNYDYEVIRFLSRYHFSGHDLPPIGIIITESDLIEDKWVPYVREILWENYTPLIAYSTVMLSAVSTADSDNLEEPIAFAAMCLLTEQARITNIALKKAKSDMQNIKSNYSQIAIKSLSGYTILSMAREKRVIEENLIKFYSIMQELESNALHIGELFSPNKCLYSHGQTVPLHSYFFRIIKDK